MSEGQASPDIGRLLRPLQSRAAIEIFGALIGITKVAVPEEDLAKLVGRDPAGEEWKSALEELEANGLVVRWAASGHGSGRIVTLTRLSADTLGVRLNYRSTRWIPKAIRDRSLKIPNGSQAITEADLAEAGEEHRLEDYPDPGATQPGDAVADFEQATRKAREAGGGLVQPLYLVGADDAWPLPTQDRGAWAPRDSAAPCGGPCAGCGDSITGEEFCLACGRWWADFRIPTSMHAMVARSPVVARDAEARAARKKRGRREAAARASVAAGERNGRVVLIEPEDQDSYSPSWIASKVTVRPKKEPPGNGEEDPPEVVGESVRPPSGDAS